MMIRRRPKASRERAWRPDRHREVLSTPGVSRMLSGAGLGLVGAAVTVGTFNATGGAFVIVRGHLRGRPSFSDWPLAVDSTLE